MTDSARIELVLLARDGAAMQQYLEQHYCRVLKVDDCSKILHVVQGHEFDSAVIDITCEDKLNLLGSLKAVDPALQAIVLEEPGERSGAAAHDADVLLKPVRFGELTASVNRSAQVTRLRRENERLRQLLLHKGNGAENTPANDTPVNGTRTNGTAQILEPTKLPTVGDDVDLESISRAHVLSLLKQNQGNKARTARVLGINRRSLYRLLEKYGS